VVPDRGHSVPTTTHHHRNYNDCNAGYSDYEAGGEPRHSGVVTWRRVGVDELATVGVVDLGGNEHAATRVGEP